MTTKSKTQIMSHDDTVMSPITKASNVLFEDGETAQDKLEDNVEKSFTPSVENSSSMFKVGQGDNVDYSGNVVDGAYVSCVLKGKTMVNCIQESSSQDVILPYEFTEGQYVTINDTKESGALSVELKGQTLVNLAKVRSKQASNAVGEVNIPIKPNTKYIAFANVTYEDISNLAMFLVSPIYVESASGLNGDSLYTATVSGKGGTEIRWNQTGVRYVTFTSTSNQCYLHIRTGGSTSNLKYNNMQVFEYQDNMENWDIPYFEGMTSCKMPILSTVGKNFFNINGYSTKNQYASINGNTITVNAPTTFSNTVYTLTGLKEGELYRVSLDKTGAGEFSIRDTNASSLLYVEKEEGHVSRTFTYEKGATIRIGNRQIVNSEVSFANIQIEHGSTETAHESYKSSILSLPEEVVLRSLPNGVCDTFNTRTGVYTQRIGDDTFIGASNENWRTPNNYTTGDTMPFRITKPTMQGNGRVVPLDIICDKMKIETPRNAWGNDGYDGEGLSHGTGKGEGVDVRILKSKLPTEDVAGFKQWLSQNPIRVQYQLHTPIITKVNLSSTLKPWNTTTHIYTEIPQNSLYPILSHSNPTYPVILKPSTKYSIVANSYSNGHTNAAINFNLGGATASTTVGNRVTMVTTPSTLSNELLTMSGKGNKLNNVMVIEGDVVGDEPYFEGICDVKSPVVKNVGKNLFDYNLLDKQSYTKNGLTFVVIGDTLTIKGTATSGGYMSLFDYTLFDTWGSGVYANTDKYIELGEGTYCISTHGKITKPEVRLANAFGQGTKLIGHIYPKDKTTFTIQNNERFGLCLVFGFSNGATYDEEIKIQLEKTSSNTFTTYEPHKSNTTTFNQKDGKIIVLRSLPNGVRDTLNVETGEYVQRIGETTFNGNENWTLLRDNENENIVFSCVGFNGYVNVSGGEPSILCDKIIPKKPWFSICSQTSSNGITLMDSRKGCRIGLVRSEGVTNAGEFRAWLSQNPITIQYELATPIISTIDVQGFPHAYKDGHVQLSSGYNGQSLTPKIEYSLPINRNGQIRMNQAMVERHQKHIDKLQAIIITNMVNTQYRQSLTKINYQLGGEQV